MGWNNDPKGMVWHNGKWHLFFQHNPTGLGHGNMTWGHATSTDLVHWVQQGGNAKLLSLEAHELKSIWGN